MTASAVTHKLRERGTRGDYREFMFRQQDDLRTLAGDVKVVPILSPQARTFTIWETIEGRRAPTILWDGRLIEIYAQLNFGLLAENDEERDRLITFAFLSLLAEQALAAGALELSIGYAQQIRRLTELDPGWYCRLVQVYEDVASESSPALTAAYVMTRIQELFVIHHELAHIWLANDEHLREEVHSRVMQYLDLCGANLDDMPTFEVQDTGSEQYRSFREEAHKLPESRPRVLEELACDVHGIAGTAQVLSEGPDENLRLLYSANMLQHQYDSLIIGAQEVFSSLIRQVTPTAGSLRQLSGQVRVNVRGWAVLHAMQGFRSSLEPISEFVEGASVDPDLYRELTSCIVDGAEHWLDDVDTLGVVEAFGARRLSELAGDRSQAIFEILETTGWLTLNS